MYLFICYSDWRLFLKHMAFGQHKQCLMNFSFLRAPISISCKNIIVSSSAFPLYCFESLIFGAITWNFLRHSIYFSMFDKPVLAVLFDCFRRIFNQKTTVCYRKVYNYSEMNSNHGFNRFCSELLFVESFLFYNVLILVSLCLPVPMIIN